MGSRLPSCYDYGDGATRHAVVLIASEQIDFQQHGELNADGDHDNDSLAITGWLLSKFDLWRERRSKGTRVAVCSAVQGPWSLDHCI